MSSYFAELERMATDAVDSMYGETVLVKPMASGSGYYSAGGEDGSRDPMTVTAVVDFNPVAVTVTDEGQFDGFQPTVTADKVHVSFDAELFTEWKPRLGDVISLVGRSPVMDLKIVRDPEDDGIGRFICVCVPS